MGGESIHLRVEPKLLHHLQADAKRKEQTVPGLIRSILKAKYNRKRARSENPLGDDFVKGKRDPEKEKGWADWFVEKK